MGNFCPHGTIYLLYILFLASTCECEYLRSNTSFAAGVIRERRQAGYVYDRPSKSFNLPSRTTIGSTSTQATNVDRTSAQQMYYAYPVPAGGSSVRTSYSSASSTATSSSAASEAGGYKYNSAIENTANTLAGGTTSTISVGSGSTGYTYSDGKQDTALGSAGGTSTGSGSSGYSYKGGIKDSGSVESGTLIANTGTVGSQEGSKGYSYSGILQKTDSGSIDGSTVSASLRSDSSGYSYSGAAPNTQSGSIGTSNAVTTGVGSSSTGYNYDTQNIGNRNSQTESSFVPRLYNTPSSGPLSTVSVDTSSTNAPQYLPPTSGSSGDVAITTNTQTNSVSQIVTPSDKYLPPVQNTQLVTQTDNIPSVNVATQTSNGPITVPSISYLQPNGGQETYNTPISGPSTGYLQPNTQKQISKMQSVVTIQGLKEDYLPPVLDTGTVTGASVSKPAATYLPPVF